MQKTLLKCLKTPMRAKRRLRRSGGAAVRQPALPGGRPGRPGCPELMLVPGQRSLIS